MVWDDTEADGTGCAAEEGIASSEEPPVVTSACASMMDCSDGRGLGVLSSACRHLSVPDDL